MRNTLLAKLKTQAKTLGPVPDSALNEWIPKLDDAFKGPIYFKRGDILIQQDENSQHLFYLLKGCVIESRIDGDKNMTLSKVHSSGDFIFSLQDFTTGLLSQTIFTCKTAVSLLKLDQKILHQFQKMKGFDILFFIIQQSMLGSDRDYTFRLQSMSPADHYRWLKEHSSFITENLTRDQMAAYLGISRATFYRILQKRI